MGKTLVRTIGAVVMLADVAVFLTERLGVVLVTHTVTPWSAREITGHAIILFIGYLLLDHDRALVAYNVVKDKLPGISFGKKESE